MNVGDILEVGRGTTRKVGTLKPDEARQAVALYQEGLSVRAIGKRLRRSQDTVSKALRAAGVTVMTSEDLFTVDRIAGRPIGKLPADHPLAAVDAMIMQARRDAETAARRRNLRLAEDGVRT